MTLRFHVVAQFCPAQACVFSTGHLLLVAFCCMFSVLCCLPLRLSFIGHHGRPYPILVAGRSGQASLRAAEGQAKVPRNQHPGCREERNWQNDVSLALHPCEDDAMLLQVSTGRLRCHRYDQDLQYDRLSATYAGSYLSRTVAVAAAAWRVAGNMQHQIRRQ